MPKIVIDPTLAVQPSAKDNYLWEASPETNNGYDVLLHVVDGAFGETYRPILEFDISSLPAGATLISASLLLYYYFHEGTDPSGKTVWAYKLTRIDWVELESTWDIYKTGSSWTSGGGDYVTSDPSGGSTIFPAGYGWMTWNVLAIVQDAYDAGNPAEFLVRFATEGLESGSSYPYFHSNDYTDDTDLCPKLVIEYETGWTGKISGVTNPAKVMGVDVANIASVKGVT